MQSTIVGACSQGLIVVNGTDIEKAISSLKLILNFKLCFQNVTIKNG